MREIETAVEISAPAPTVWRILTDLGRYPAWNPFIPSAEGKAEEGARLKVRIEPPGGRAMTFKPQVTRIRPEREFRWLGRLFIPGLFDGEHIFELEPTGQGSTRFVQREQFRGLLVPLLWSSLDQNTRQGFEKMNAALKEEAEKAGS